MTYEQVLWATSHDWYAYYYPTVTGTYMVVVQEGHHFGDYKLLREWAGY